MKKPVASKPLRIAGKNDLVGTFFGSIPEPHPSPIFFLFLLTSFKTVPTTFSSEILQTVFLWSVYGVRFRVRFRFRFRL